MHFVKNQANINTYIRPPSETSIKPDISWGLPALTGRVGGELVRASRPFRPALLRPLGDRDGFL